MNTNYNINLIKSDGGLYDLILRKNKIIEMYHDQKDGISVLNYYSYDPLTNVVTPLMPDKLILEAVRIHVCYSPCNILYVTTLEKEAGKNIINISTYDLDRAVSEGFYSFETDEKIFEQNNRLQIFVLSPTHIIVQHEVVDNESADMLMGNIKFTQYLYNIETSTNISIIEENINNNGINMITPLNESDVMIKTGFSYLEDSRLSAASEKDALIESVYVTTIGKFITDIELGLTNIDMQLISSTYNDRYILKPEVVDDYIFFNIADINSGESECVFYNYKKGQRMTAKNSDVNPDDLRLAYVIDNIPYVRKIIGANCEFINLESGENDISFYDELFLDCAGRILITQRPHKRHNRIRIYKYPKTDLIVEEKCNYIACLHSGEDYYIYIIK